MAIKLSELAEKIDCRMFGDDCVIENVADIDSAKQGQLAFIYNPKYLGKIKTTDASAIITREEWLEDCVGSVLIAENPRLAFVKATRLLNPEKISDSGVSKNAIVAENARVSKTACIGANVVINSGVEIGSGVQIGAGCVIENDVIIGDNTVIHPNVTIRFSTHIGENCIIYPGVVIGADGFGYERDGDSYLKIPQLGNVRIGNNVEIGANSTVDRGALHDTVINDGVKIDNLVQIGHNVEIGKHTVISAQSGVAGSTKVGEYCLIGGGVSIRDNIEVADNVMLTGRTLVSSAIKKSGSYSSGILVDDSKSWRKNALRFKHLDELAKRLIKLEKSIASD
ncbi:MAG: UDP-3-O-(3-hydroxymyristoyl)glucosamine N-acyltransferase [Gammaproteobacteria bacterium]|nr:MAG: UDP-3-O-(3-hydroxymyristoyl)glucosamine N-acyltransferase [Gammaproteobacteria bacterium]